VERKSNDACSKEKHENKKEYLNVPNSITKEKKKEEPKVMDASLNSASQFNFGWTKKGRIFKRINEKIP